MCHKMQFALYIVDAFTLQNNEPFTGNPAAVCILQYDDDINDEMKQKIAAEMNISETAFVANAWNRSSERHDDSCYTLRWFTPTNEVDLCGHATLATASVLFNRLKQSPNQTPKSVNKLSFTTKYKGILEAIVNDNQNTISLNFPSNECVPLNDKKWLNDIIIYTLGSHLNTDCIQDVEYSSGTKKLLLRIKDSPEPEEVINKLSPNIDGLLKVDTNDTVHGVIVTQKSNDIKVAHFISRYFAPWVGINEDPVTGSAHTVLAPYWKRQYDAYGVVTNGELIGKQCSPRSGIVFCKIIENRVLLSGKSRIVFEGNISI